MAFTRIVAAFSSAVEPFLPATCEFSESQSFIDSTKTIDIQESLDDFQSYKRSLLTNKSSRSSLRSSLESEPMDFLQNPNNKFGQLRKTQSNNTLFKNPLRRNLSSNLTVDTNHIITSPPSPEATVPLWTEQVKADVKKALDPEIIKRQEVIFEIIRTEKEFVEDLNYLLDHYVTAIQDSRIRLPAGLTHTFAALQDIYYMHKNISRQLLNIQAIYEVVPSITDALTQLVTKVETYDKYLLYHKTAIIELANARKKNTNLGQLVKTLEAHVITGRYRSLESLVTKPIQRLCKYPLLVMTLFRATPSSNTQLQNDRINLSSLHKKFDGAIRDLQERNERAKREELNRTMNSSGLKAPFKRSSAILRQHRRVSSLQVNG
ncbi:hypothetical protein G9A89_009882 [Geosiphon pyriformis]|nr:hypothetical protein G9A89_009882 [Geosiphon pyriformis]